MKIDCKLIVAQHVCFLFFTGEMIMNKKYNKRPAAELFVILKTICFLPGRFLYNVNSFNQRIKISSRLYVDTCIVNPLSDIGAGVIKFTLTL